MTAIPHRPDADDRPGPADLVERELEFVYQDGDGYVFIDAESFDLVTLAHDRAGPLDLPEGSRVRVVFRAGVPCGLGQPGNR